MHYGFSLLSGSSDLYSILHLLDELDASSVTYSFRKSSGGPLQPGDIIFYPSNLFVCGDRWGMRTPKLRVHRSIPILNDKVGQLGMLEQVPTMKLNIPKIKQPDGMLVDNTDAQSRQIQESKLDQSVPAVYLSVKAIRVDRPLGSLSNQYIALAEDHCISCDK